MCCLSRAGFVNLNKSSTIFSFRRRKKFKMAEHFEYNHIPAQMSSVNHFRVVSVVCFRERLVVLHLSRSGANQLGVIDLDINKFRGMLPSKFVTQGNVHVYGALSPDKTRCLVRLPVVSHQSRYSVLHLYDVTEKKLLREIKLDTLCTSHFDFDPRFAWQRVAITNFDTDSRHNNLSLVDLKVMTSLETNSRVTDQHPSLYPFLRNLQYSPDGSLVVVTLVNTACRCRQRRSNQPEPVDCDLIVLDGSTAVTLRRIQFLRFTCISHFCPTNYVPIFSSCGSRMAVVVNRRDEPDKHFVQVYKLPQRVDLMSVCRVAIRQNFTQEQIGRLRLPARSAPAGRLS